MNNRGWIRERDYYRKDFPGGIVAYIQFRGRGFWNWIIEEYGVVVDSGKSRDREGAMFSGRVDSEDEVKKAIRRIRRAQHA